MAEQSGEKTLEPTPHRREEARGKGQVAFSQDLGSAALLVVGVSLLMMLGGAVMEFAAALMKRQLGQITTLTPDSHLLFAQWRTIFTGLAQVMLPIFGFILLTGVLTNVFQVGFLFLPDKLVPDVSRLSLFQGLKRIFSITGIMRLGFGLFKILVIGSVASVALWYRWEEVLGASALDLRPLATFLIDITLGTVLWIGLALMLLAMLDYAFQRWKHEQDLMMTHQESREEMKNMQGDPQILARRRAIQRQMAMNRMSDAVPTADVVITNPTELAIAIQYKPNEMAAPIVVAKGAGVLAQRIRRLALESNIPIVERKPLAQLLYKEVEINHPVPDGSYAAAEVLAYVYQLQGKKIPTPPRAA